MLKTTRILLPAALLCLTLLGFAAIYSGGVIDVQWGIYNRIRIEGAISDSLEDES